MKTLSATETDGAAASTKIQTQTDFGLYFHVPFCSKKCPYCHFFVVPDNALHKHDYLEALKLEWEQVKPNFEGKKLRTVYFGGGTPTLLGADGIGTILSWISPLDDCEVTIEANPETVTPELMKSLLSVGINRVSIGIQSLDDGLLSLLGRTHSAEKAINAVETVARAGISNITIDLMFELPHQTLASWRETLLRARALPITHLSLYNLTFEPETVFFKKRKQLLPHVPEPETNLAMLQMAVELLEEVGFHRYEISAFARPGMKAKHNTAYWTARPFWGLGPSAFSYWNGSRFRNTAHLARYTSALRSGQSPIDFRETLPYPDNLHELLAIHLRLLNGVDFPQSLPAATHTKIAELITKGLLRQTNNRLQLTEQGLLFYDEVASHLI
jgi:oxygen-independent coproporphyrinogen-3 oxidase